ncbi:MAG: GTP-binding protein, partial [Pseudomonadota bacterium]
MSALDERQQLRVVTLGHVDHGKSTLIGRLFNDLGMLPEGRLEEIQAVSARRGMPFEWAFLTDAMKSERDQGVTIDTAQIWLKAPGLDLAFIDAPGHREFLRNMLTGAAQADAALVLVDAKEGVRAQTRTHAFLLSMLGVEQIVVLVNKIDLIDFDADRFAEVKADADAVFGGLGLRATATVPVVARDGDNLIEPSDRTPWHDGATLLSVLRGFSPAAPAHDRPLRLPLQGVYKFDDRRLLAGRIVAGGLKVGDRLTFSPSGLSSTVASVEAWNAPDRTTATAGESVAITLTDQIFVERGEIASREADAPKLSDVMRGRIFWMSDAPLREGETVELRVATSTAQVRVQAIESVLDTDELIRKPGGADAAIERFQAADVVLRADRRLAVDEHGDSPSTGRFALARDGGIVGCGLASLEGYPDQRRAGVVKSRNLHFNDHSVTAEQRAERAGHRGGVLWLTGLSGAGKSTVAIAAEQALFARGWQVYVLDGDNVRRGLNRDLGFSPEDRAENIRRVGEVAALMARAG